MLKIITLNLNGIRSAIRKGLYEWLQQENADIICVQELKAQENDLVDQAFALVGYHFQHHYAVKKGYSGVGIYSRLKPKSMTTGLGWEVADTEGRYVVFDFDGLCVASLYLPSGTSGPERQTVKYDFLARYQDHLEKNKKNNCDYIICGDFNIAHKEIDLKNWRSNQKNSGFLPEERAWMDQLFADGFYHDAFRSVNKEADQYTWWSNRARAWDNNVGWRIDYQVVSEGLKSKIKSANIFKAQRFSDHAPLIMEYDIIL